MYRLKYNRGFAEPFVAFFGMFVLLLVILTLGYGIYLDYKKTTDKHNQKLNKTASDTEILISRNYVKDRDERVEKAIIEINECIKDAKMNPPSCMKMYYDKYGIDYSEYTVGDVQINNTEYMTHKKISQFFLSTETK